MLSEMREEVIKVMQNDEYLSKLKCEKWYIPELNEEIREEE